MKEESHKQILSEGCAELEHELGFALYCASRAIIDVYRPMLDELGITYPQYLVMLSLWEHKCCSVKDIGKLLHLDSGTLSPLLKRLESAGLIRRQRRTEDERIVDISPTEAGWAMQVQAATIPAQFACELGISHDEYLNVMTSLNSLVSHLYTREMERQTDA